MNLDQMSALELLDMIARAGVSIFKLNNLGCLIVQTHLVNKDDAKLLAGALIDKTKRPIIELPDDFRASNPANMN